MKQLLLLTLSLLVTVGTVKAQKIDYDNSSKWFLGVNVGGAWQTTDVKNQMGSGWGLTLGRSYNYNYGKAFYFDIRARYLGGKWYGQDYFTTDLTDYNPDNEAGFPLQPYKDAPGSVVVNNFQTEVHRLGLELVLHANGIRERTGWDPYIFGGIGLSWHQTYGDLYFADSTGGIYDYASLGTNVNSTTISGLNDGIYETALTGSDQNTFAVGVMPSLGFGLGYQIGKRVTLGVEHKTTFTGMDHFDGFESSVVRDKQDLYHYTSLYLQFRFRTGNRGGGGSSVNNVGNYNTNTNNLTNCDLPVIRITDPVTGAQLQGGQIYTVRAEINRINGRDKITFLHNGVISNNFTYDPTSGRVESQVLLAEGTNTFEIRAFNSCGNVTQSVSMNYMSCTSPIANWTNPASSGNVVMQANVNVSAQLIGVTGRESIIFRQNGTIISAFVFNPSNGIFESNINLLPGQNTLEITVTNSCGADVKSTTLVYQNCVNPLISITEPNAPNQERNVPAYTVRARIDNVTTANQVQFRVNGAVLSGGTYNSTTKIYSRAITLNEGGNTVEIVATNNCGSSSALTTIIYKRASAPVVQAPVIAVSNPSSCPVNVSPGNSLVTGTVQNVSAANQLSITMNGNPVTFTSSSVGNNLNFQFTFNAQASVGHYNIGIVAVNQGGTASWNCIVNVIQPVEEQKITICHYPPGNNGNPQTLEIPLSAWPAHQAHGDILGPCPAITPDPIEEQKITICHYPPGNNGNPQTLEIPLSAWPAHQAHGDILGPCPAITPDPIEEQKITICHYPPGNNGNPQTLEIPLSAWPAHQAHGDILGPCPPTTPGNNGNQGGNGNTGNNGNQGGNNNQGGGQNEQKVTICHYPPGNNGNPQTLEIPLSAWPAHQAHGDILGPCPPTTPGNNGNQGGNGNTGNNGNQGGNNNQGGGQNEQKVTICHYPPGNNGNPQTLEIPLSAWPAHQAHGDILGPCPPTTPGNNGNQGGNGNTGNNGNQGGNNNQGGGQNEQKVTICHYPPGNNGNPQTLEIPLSAWPAHQAHGDILGPCPPTTPGNNGNQGGGNQGGNGNTGNNGNQGGNNNQGGGQSGTGSTGNTGGQDTSSGSGCLPVVGSTFTPNSITALVTSTKDLSNVVLKFCDNTTQKFEGLTGLTGTFSGTGTNTGKCISGIWIKSGCNQSNDGPGYGEFVSNNNMASTCCVQDQGTTGCLPVVGATFDPTSISVTVISTKDLSNVVLKFCDNTTQKYEGLIGLTGTFIGSGQHVGKCIIGVWIKSGCNQSADGPGYGEFVGNNAVAVGCCAEGSGTGTGGQGGNGNAGNGGKPATGPGNTGGGNRAPKPAGTTTNPGTNKPSNTPKQGTQEVPKPIEKTEKGDGDEKSGDGEKSIRPTGNGKTIGGRGGQ
jgi:hypothetical protein